MSSTDSTDIKPCPFCGSKSTERDGPRYVYNDDAFTGMMHEIFCWTCHIIMSDYTKKEVISKWNKRS